jgi:malonyl-CoA/methylmalonyl-CoA synthetase
MPLNAAFREAEISYFFSDATPKVAIAAPHLAAMAEAVAARTGVRHVLSLGVMGDGSFAERARGLDGDAPVATGGAEDANSIVYTSGTTGRPKGAVITNGLAIWNALVLKDLWQFRPDDVLLHVIPIAFGLFGTTNVALMTGCSMILLPKFEVEPVMRNLPRATIFAGVPTYYVRLLANPDFGRETCRSMRLFITGSAPMRGDIFRAFTERTGHVLLDRYGMTETLLFTSNRLDERREPDNSGLPVPGVTVRIADERNRPVPEGEIGMIQMRAPYMFKGYWNLPDKTRESYSDDGYFITGDLGRILPNGHVALVGRGKDLIITGGINVYPKEIESYLNAIAGVAESAVVGVPHPDFGEGVIAVVQRTAGRSTLSESGVIASLKGSIANFKVPKRIFFVDEMPRNALGKIQKNLLRDANLDTFRPST